MTDLRQLGDDIIRSFSGTFSNGDPEITPSEKVYSKITLTNDWEVLFHSRTDNKGRVHPYYLLFRSGKHFFRLDLTMLIRRGEHYTWFLKTPDKNSVVLGPIIELCGEISDFPKWYQEAVFEQKERLRPNVNVERRRSGFKFVHEGSKDELLKRLHNLIALTFKYYDAFDDSNDQVVTDDLDSFRKEGKKRNHYGTRYERDPRLRKEAIRLHGTTCEGCGLNFEETYGSHGAGFIHIHHKKPLGSVRKEHDVNPKTDLVPVCANCHAMIHRNRDNTLTISELQTMLTAQITQTEQRA